MGTIAAILVAVGIIALIAGAFLKLKSGRIAKTPLVPTGQALRHPAGEKVSVQGAVLCPQPVLSPVTQTPCLYYELKVIGTWKDGDSNKSKDYVHEKVAAGFAIDDGSGSIPVDAGQGGDYEMQKTFDETKKEGLFADLKNAVGTPEPLIFGHYAFPNPPMSKANKFQCIERIVPMPAQAFALGKVEQGVLTSPGMFGLLLSSKSRDELLGSSAKNSKMAFIGGAAAAAVGMTIGAISSFVG